VPYSNEAVEGKDVPIDGLDEIVDRLRKNALCIGGAWPQGSNGGRVRPAHGGQQECANRREKQSSLHESASFAQCLYVRCGNRYSEVLTAEEGSLYPALQKVLINGWVTESGALAS
jgi:hypothetical protein